VGAGRPIASTAPAASVARLGFAQRPQTKEEARNKQPVKDGYSPLSDMSSMDIEALAGCPNTSSTFEANSLSVLTHWNAGQERIIETFRLTCSPEM
jgi:hypothetical protein